MTDSEHRSIHTFALFLPTSHGMDLAERDALNEYIYGQALTRSLVGFFFFLFFFYAEYNPAIP